MKAVNRTWASACEDEIVITDVAVEEDNEKDNNKDRTVRGNLLL